MIGDHGSSADNDYDAAGFTLFNDDDDQAEVDAAFRLQRRIAIGYFVLFIAATVGVAVALLTLRWMSEASIFGGFTPGFALAAFGLYLFFVAMGAAASSLANGVDDRMMGTRSLDHQRRRA